MSALNADVVDTICSYVAAAQATQSFMITIHMLNDLDDLEVDIQCTYSVNGFTIYTTALRYGRSRMNALSEQLSNIAKALRHPIRERQVFISSSYRSNRNTRFRIFVENGNLAINVYGENDNRYGHDGYETITIPGHLCIQAFEDAHVTLNDIIAKN